MVLELEGAAVPAALRGQNLSFELKSATGGKPIISTVRDFGLHHVEKWRPLHWLFGVYEPISGETKFRYCLYGSPERMKPWFDQMAAYVAPDVALAATGDAILASVLDEAEEFTYDDARRLMKNQYSRQAYREAVDEVGRTTASPVRPELNPTRGNLLFLSRQVSPGH